MSLWDREHRRYHLVHAVLDDIARTGRPVLPAGFGPAVDAEFGDFGGFLREVALRWYRAFDARLDALLETWPEHPLGFCFLSRYEEASALLRATGLSVEDRNLAAGTVREQYETIAGDNDRNVVNYSMLDRDPPDHTRLRSLVTKVFTPRSVAALEPEITALVDEALDRIAGAGRVDLVEELAFPLPFAVISKMLGMPPTDHVRIRELSGTVVRSLEVVTDAETMEAIGVAAEELSAITRELIAWKRANPADDLLTKLIAAEHDGM